MTTSWSTRAIGAADPVRAVSGGARVFVHGAAATPTRSLEALAGPQKPESVTRHTALG